MISKRLLIDSLNEVKQRAILGIILEPEYGICKNWCEMLDDAFSYTLVENLSFSWKYRTEWDEYPVPDDERYGLWEGVNLEMRLSLIDHVLKCLEEYSQEDIDGWYRNL